jgi:hypothetical protein
MPLLMAREWGLPPWEIEEQVSELWMARWLTLQNAEGAAHKMPSRALTPGHRRLV